LSAIRYGFDSLGYTQHREAMPVFTGDGFATRWQLLGRGFTMTDANDRAVGHGRRVSGKRTNARYEIFDNAEDLELLVERLPKPRRASLGTSVAFSVFGRDGAPVGSMRASGVQLLFEIDGELVARLAPWPMRRISTGRDFVVRDIDDAQLGWIAHTSDRGAAFLGGGREFVELFVSVPTSLRTLIAAAPIAVHDALQPGPSPGG